VKLKQGKEKERRRRKGEMQEKKSENERRLERPIVVFLSLLATMLGCGNCKLHLFFFLKT
jgi:hypothetical protein